MRCTLLGLFCGREGGREGAALRTRGVYLAIADLKKYLKNSIGAVLIVSAGYRLG